MGMKTSKPTKTEVLLTRVTPATKFKIDRLVNRGWFSSQADLFNAGLKLILADYTDLFINIAKNQEKFPKYAITSEEQRQLLGHAYDHLSTAFSDLTKLTDHYMYREDEGLEAAPNEYKDTLRDFLMPLLKKTLKDYEDKNHILFDDRFTEPDDPDEYEEKYPGSANDN